MTVETRRSIWTEPIRFRFSLRTLMLVTMLVGIATAWTTWKIRDQRAQLLKQMENERWWRQLAFAQGRNTRDEDQGRQLAFAQWPRLSELDAADISMDYENGKVVLLNFITRPETDDEVITHYLDKYAAELASLDTLSLENSRVSPRLIARLESLHLSELWLDNCTGITDEAIEKLVRLKSLTHLRIPGTSISAAGAARLRDALPNCLIMEGERERTAE